MKILFVLDNNTFGVNYIDVATSVAAHCDAIWYRAKQPQLTICEIYDRAVRLRNILPNATLILSELAYVAVSAGFNGVHLNKQTLPIACIKALYPTLLVGYSAHSTAECSTGADYYTLSPIFETNKQHKTFPLGAIPAPAPNVYALGGVKLENINQLAKLGYAGIAGISLHKDLIYDNMASTP
ncbi:thiamine phosphate synthase [Deferribacterales bacterium RsTz2092]|nr:putative thiamine-phosphate synthase 2 [Deferribacterales bacterium]